MSFAALVESQADHYFGKLLPRYITAWYRGAGQLFAVRQLEVLDDDSFDRAAAETRPTWRARRMAARVRRNCPLRVRDAPERPRAGAVTLGQFLNHELYVRTSPVTSQTLEQERWVELYSHGFAALRLEGEALARQVLHTIVHEYLHYFESFLLRSQQALRGREEWDPAARRMTAAEAARRDRRVTAWRLIGRTLLVGALLVAAGIIVWSKTSLHERGWREDAGRLARLSEVRAELVAERDRLAAVAAAPEARDELARVERDLAALDAQGRDALRRAPALATSGSAEPLGYAEGVTLKGDGGSAALAGELARPAREHPALQLTLARLSQGRYEAELRLREPSPPPAPKPLDRRLLLPPFFPAGDGPALRREVAALEEDIARLRAELGPLAALPEKRAELGAAERSGDALGPATCLLGAAGMTPVGERDGGWVFSADRGAFLGPLELPAPIVDGVDCPGGAWRLDQAEALPKATGRFAGGVSLTYRFTATAPPLPHGASPPAVRLTRLLPARPGLPEL